MRQLVSKKVWVSKFKCTGPGCKRKLEIYHNGETKSDALKHGLPTSGKHDGWDLNKSQCPVHIEL